MSLRCAVAVAAVVLAMVVPAMPASAATTTIEDGRESSLPAPMDILDVSITNGERRVVLVTRFRDLREGRRANLKILVDPRPGDEVRYIASVRRTATGRNVGALLLSTSDHFDGTRLPCRGYRARWDLAANSVRIVVPQRCLKQNGDVHNFKAVAGFWNVRDGDYTRFKRVRRG